MIYFLTIALDAQPWIEHHYPEFSRLKETWKWLVAEGVAEPVADTAWVQRIPPRVSMDGTHEYLVHTMHAYEHLHHIDRPSWSGKTAMFNEMLKHCHEPGLVWQVDSDELWHYRQIESVIAAFKEHPENNCARFWCRYFIGPDIVITSRDTYGNHHGEWLRVWRYHPGQMFACHEPPRFGPMAMNCFSREDMESRGCVFDHMAYATEQQVAFKAEYYKYIGAVAAWRRLQQNTKWPAKVSEFLPWVTDGAVCERIKV